MRALVTPLLWAIHVALAVGARRHLLPWVVASCGGFVAGVGFEVGASLGGIP